MASYPESEYQLCPLCKETCVSAAPISSSSSSSSSSQTSTCSSSGVCLGSTPRKLHILPCLHAFCRQCLEAQRSPGDSLQLRCPVCDHKVLISEAGMDALPSSTFLHLSNLLDVVVGAAEEQSNGSRAGGSAGRPQQHRSRSSSCSSSSLLRRAPPSLPEPRCSSCDEGNGASSHCLDCQENLCDNCLRAHQRVRLTKDHFIERFPGGRVPISGTASPCSGSTTSSSSTSSSSSTLCSVPLPYQGNVFSIMPMYSDRISYCQQHDEEVLHFYCDTCSVPICRECTVGRHAGHNFTYLQDALQDSRAHTIKLLADAQQGRQAVSAEPRTGPSFGRAS